MCPSVRPVIVTFVSMSLAMLPAVAGSIQWASAQAPTVSATGSRARENPPRQPAPKAAVESAGPELLSDDEEFTFIAANEREIPPSFPLDLGWVYPAPPLTLESLRGRVVLIEVWDLSCIHCLRTLPILSRLYSRYSGHGLTVIGIHSPEYAFTANHLVVERASHRLGLNFPVASDSRRTFWRSWDLHGWPTAFLLDARGRLANMHEGEFTATMMERWVRTLLKEARPAQQLPSEETLTGNEDPYVPECGFVTPEVPTMANREFLLNPEGYRPGETIVYAEPGPARREGTFYLKGPWSWLPYGLQRGAGGTPASIGVTYTGKEVYAVLVNGSTSPQEIEVRQDGKYLTDANKGRDVETLQDGRSVLRLSESRLHYLVVNPVAGRHDVELFPTSPFFQIHSFSFCNRCQTSFPHR